MKKIKIETELSVYDSVSDLPSDIKELMNEALTARENAYAPYSRFKVGAAVLLTTGEIVTGNNQENAAFPSGLCAERVAVYKAGASYPETAIKAIAMSAISLNQETTTPIPPCGACRQALAEYEVKQHAPLAVYFMGKSGKVVMSNSVKDILPLVFDSSYL